MKLLTILVCAVLLLSGAGGLVPTVQAQDGDCSKTPPTHFQFDDRVRVTNQYGGQLTLWLYEEPSGNSQTVGSLPSGSEAVILQVDPVCNGGQQFWFVAADDSTTGWVVSASENDNNPNNQLNVVLEIVGEDVSVGVSTLGDVIVEDDFSDENSGWAWGDAESPGWSAKYQQGMFLQSLSGEWAWAYTQFHPGDLAWNLDDYSLEVDVTSVTGNGHTGVVFRRAEPYQFYIFLINPSEGTFAFALAGEAERENWEWVQPWTFSDAIELGGETNRLKITALGDQIALYVNDEFLMMIEDDTLSSGWIALFTGRNSSEQTGGQLAGYEYDDFVLRTPDELPDEAPVITGGCQASVGRSVNIRSGPGEQYTVLGSLNSGETLPVVGLNGTWYAVQFGGREGWVAGWIVNLTSSCTGLAYREPSAAVLAPTQPATTPTDTPIAPPSLPGEQISFTVNGAAEATVNAGQCATVRWDVEGIQSVFYQGIGVSGHDQRQECPAQTTTYELRVVHRDGSQTTHTVRVNVTADKPQILLWANGTPVSGGSIELCKTTGSLALRWQVTGAASVRYEVWILPLNGVNILGQATAVPASGDAYEVSPPSADPEVWASYYIAALDTNGTIAAEASMIGKWRAANCN